MHSLYIEDTLSSDMYLIFPFPLKKGDMINNITPFALHIGEERSSLRKVARNLWIHPASVLQLEVGALVSGMSHWQAFPGTSLPPLMEAVLKRTSFRVYTLEWHELGREIVQSCTTHAIDLG